MDIQNFSVFGGIDYLMQCIAFRYTLYFIIMYMRHIISISNPK